MTMHDPPLHGLVLAGGQSSRMGTDKAAIEIGGRTLLDQAVTMLGSLVDAVYVGVRADQATDGLRSRFPSIIDAPGIGGPAASLVAASRRDPGAAWLVVACDMPGLGRDLLAGLVAARDPARGGTAWRGADGTLPEPLCAIWEPATLARLAEETGKAGTRPLSPRAWLAAADPLLLNPARPAALESVNTPADLLRYLEDPHGHKP